MDAEASLQMQCQNVQAAQRGVLAKQQRDAQADQQACGYRRDRQADGTQRQADRQHIGQHGEQADAAQRAQGEIQPQLFPGQAVEGQVDQEEQAAEAQCCQVGTQQRHAGSATDQQATGLQQAYAKRHQQAALDERDQAAQGDGICRARAAAAGAQNESLESSHDRLRGMGSQQECLPARLVAGWKRSQGGGWTAC